MIRSGEMRHQVSIQRRLTVKDTAGEEMEQWDEVANRRASVQRTPGQEVWASASRNGRVPTVFELRFVDGILPGMRVIFGTKIYNIISAIDPTGLKEKLVVSTEELVVG